MRTAAYASVYLGWRPSDFWAATPREFWAVAELQIEKSKREAPKK